MIKASIYKPITMLMVILTVVVFGIYTYSMMPVNMLPNFEVPVVTATVKYTGASTDELETTVIKPVEDQVELIDGIDYPQGYSPKAVPESKHLYSDLKFSPFRP